MQICPCVANDKVGISLGIYSCRALICRVLHDSIMDGWLIRLAYGINYGSPASDTRGPN